MTELPENVAKTELVAALGNAKQGASSFGQVGYGGPCPPKGHGVHHYHFKLYALDTELNLASRLRSQQLEAAMKGHIIGADRIGWEHTGRIEGKGKVVSPEKDLG